MNIPKLKTALEAEERELETQLINVRRAIRHLGVCQGQLGKVVRVDAAA